MDNNLTGHEDTWTVLTRYKMLEDKVTDLKAQALLTLAPSEDIEATLHEAEAELAKLRLWISANFDAKKVD